MCKMHKEKTAFFEKWDLHRKERGDIIVENGGVIMRDFPIFTTEYGVSSLFLKEIPYKMRHISVSGMFRRVF